MKEIVQWYSIQENYVSYCQCNVNSYTWDESEILRFRLRLNDTWHCNSIQDVFAVIQHMSSITYQGRIQDF